MLQYFLASLFSNTQRVISPNFVLLRRCVVKIFEKSAPHFNPYSAFSFFSKTLFDFKKSISGLIELKFSGKTPNEVLYAPIYFWGVYF